MAKKRTLFAVRSVAPSSPGFYWWKGSVDDEWQMAHISMVEGDSAVTSGLRVSFLESSDGRSPGLVEVMRDFPGCHWSGPVPKPLCMHDAGGLGLRTTDLNSLALAIVAGEKDPWIYYRCGRLLLDKKQEMYRAADRNWNKVKFAGWVKTDCPLSYAVACRCMTFAKKVGWSDPALKHEVDDVRGPKLLDMLMKGRAVAVFLKDTATLSWVSAGAKSG